MDPSEDEEWRRGIESNPAYKELVERYGLDYAEVHRDERLRRLMEGMYAVLRGLDNKDDPDEDLRPIEDADTKRRDLHDWLAGGGDWCAVHEMLGLSVNTQARLLFNGHPSPMILWAPEKIDDFQQDVRSGMGWRKLMSRYQLPKSQTMKLVRVFRGIE